MRNQGFGGVKCWSMTVPDLMPLHGRMEINTKLLGLWRKQHNHRISTNFFEYRPSFCFETRTWTHMNCVRTWPWKINGCSVSGRIKSIVNKKLGPDVKQHFSCFPTPWCNHQTTNVFPTFLLLRRKRQFSGLEKCGGLRAGRICHS